MKIHFNYLPVQFNDRNLANNVHEIFSETKETRFWRLI